jgi:NAD(P)-dependent dehydrogenase (short-subunit alcohol dehydrogenase family)
LGKSNAKERDLSVASEKQLRILITGAGRGIGRAIVAALKDSPLQHKIAVTARTESELESSIEGALGEHLIITANLLEPRAPLTVVEEVVKRFGGIDLLILNAGDGQAASIEDTDDQLWNQTLELNATAPFRFIRAITPIMKRQKSGKIVVVASQAGLVGEAHVSAYTASKHAVVGLTRSAAAELKHHGITVNAVCPIFVDTPMMQKSIDAAVARTGRSAEETKALLAAKQPAGRILTPEEVATAVLSYIDNERTGETQLLDGSGGS